MGTVGRGSGAATNTGTEEVPQGQTARVPAGRDRWWGPGDAVVTVGQAAWRNSWDGAADQCHVTEEDPGKDLLRSGAPRYVGKDISEAPCRAGMAMSDRLCGNQLKRLGVVGLPDIAMSAVDL